MTDGSGPPSSEPFASLGPDGWSLRTHPLCWDLTTGEPSAESSPRWPKQGMTLGGDAYELPTWEHRTEGSGCSSLLRTPQAQVTEAKRGIKLTGRRERVKAEHNNGNGFGLSLGMAVQLLPTPSAADGAGGHLSRGQDRGDELLLAGVAKQVGQRLLPTPTVGDAKSARNSTAKRHVLPPSGVHAGDTLTDVLVPTGASTPPPSPAGSGCSDPPPTLWTDEDD
jgi:hypothetical protein